MAEKGRYGDGTMAGRREPGGITNPGTRYGCSTPERDDAGARSRERPGRRRALPRRDGARAGDPLQPHARVADAGRDGLERGDEPAGAGDRPLGAAARRGGAGGAPAARAADAVHVGRLAALGLRLAAAGLLRRLYGGAALRPLQPDAPGLGGGAVEGAGGRAGARTAAGAGGLLGDRALAAALVGDPLGADRAAHGAAGEPGAGADPAALQ